MQQPERFSDLPEYAFPRLRALLDPVEPGGEPIAMSLGEPRHALPPFLAKELAKHTALYGKYPPNQGAPELLEAISGWLRRRYNLSKNQTNPNHQQKPHDNPIQKSTQHQFSLSNLNNPKQLNEPHQLNHHPKQKNKPNNTTHLHTNNHPPSPKIQTHLKKPS